MIPKYIWTHKTIIAKNKRYVWKMILSSTPLAISIPAYIFPEIYHSIFTCSLSTYWTDCVNTLIDCHWQNTWNFEGGQKATDQRLVSWCLIGAILLVWLWRRSSCAGFMTYLYWWSYIVKMKSREDENCGRLVKA